MPAPQPRNRKPPRPASQSGRWPMLAGLTIEIGAATALILAIGIWTGSAHSDRATPVTPGAAAVAR